MRDEPVFPIRSASIADFDALCDIDTDASALFVSAGLDFESASDNEFERNEQQRWLQSLAAGSCWIAIGPGEREVGFAALTMLDSEPYLQQISVRANFMRRGIGAWLIGRVVQAALDAGHSRLWLTTYAHLAWNRPFYERLGFTVVPDRDCGRELQGVLDFERRWLPQAQMRVAMCRSVDGPRSLRARS
jgi:GNAT superfamily N-acetyltransferase